MSLFEHFIWVLAILAAVLCGIVYEQFNSVPSSNEGDIVLYPPAHPVFLKNVKVSDGPRDSIRIVESDGSVRYYRGDYYMRCK